MRIVRNFALYRRKLLVKWFIFQVWLLLQVWESILIVCMRLEKPQFRIGAWTIVVIWPTFKRWKKLFEKMFGLSWGNQLLELLWSWKNWIIFGLRKLFTISLPINWQSRAVMRMIPAVLKKMLPATSREKKEEQFTYRRHKKIPKMRTREIVVCTL